MQLSEADLPRLRATSHNLDMENCNPTTCAVSIGPCDDNGTSGDLKLIDGKWWFCTEQGKPVREVPDSEVIGMKW